MKGPRRKTRSDKFPLTLHPTGQYCKKIKGKIHYFGTDKKRALEKYLDQAAYLHGASTQRSPDPAAPPRSKNSATSTCGISMRRSSLARLLQGTTAIRPGVWANWSCSWAKDGRSGTSPLWIYRAIRGGSKANMARPIG